MNILGMANVSAWRRKAYNVAQMRLLASQALPKPVFDFADGGAEDEITLRRNEAAFADIAFLPRPLNGVSGVDLSIELFGERLALPFLLGPTGLAGRGTLNRTSSRKSRVGLLLEPWLGLPA